VDYEDCFGGIGAGYVSVVIGELGDVARGFAVPFKAFDATGGV